MRIGYGTLETDEFTFSLENCDPKDVGKLDFAMLATVYSIILNPTELPKMQTLDKVVYQFSSRAGKPEKGS